jgi:hypothetical protein
VHVGALSSDRHQLAPFGKAPRDGFLEPRRLLEDEGTEVGSSVEVWALVVPFKAMRFAVNRQPIEQRVVGAVVAGLGGSDPISPGRVAAWLVRTPVITLEGCVQSHGQSYRLRMR